MEESCDVNSENDKALPEMNKKRTVKTRAQVEALEKFYDEHKYPTESMKAEVAKSIGLTDKQVSGWFCHRRLKDKRLLNGEAYANGRQDRSSGIIQDHGSGLKQDSCGSTKQGDDRSFDPREVESRRLTSLEYSTANVTYELGRHYTGHRDRPDDTSSGSTSSLQTLPFPCDEDPLNKAISRCQMQCVPTEIKGLKARTGPSGYLKVKGQVENAAITAVKRQLGRHYRIDGPPLGVEFEPLPPGAFESQTQEAHNELYKAEEPGLRQSPDVSIVHKDPHSGTGYGYNSKTSSHNSDVDVTKFKTAHGSDQSESYFHQKFKQKSPVSRYTESFSMKSSFMDTHEGSIKTTFDSWDTHQRSKHGVGRMSLDSVPVQHHLSPCGIRVYQEQPETWLQTYNDVLANDVPAEDSEHKPSNMTSNGNEYHDVQLKGPSRRMRKEAKIYGERMAGNDDFGSVRIKVLPKHEMRAGKRVKNEVRREHYGKASLSESPSWTNAANLVPRSAAHMPSSFSDDDETAMTSSSED